MEQVTESGTCQVPHTLTHIPAQSDVSEEDQSHTKEAAPDQ